jgi:PAS domain S-box-containing protein
MRCDRQFQAVFEEAIDAMIIANDEGRCIDVNPAACNLFQLRKDRLLGRQLKDFAEPRSKGRGIERAIRETKSIRGEFQLRRSDGTLRDVDYSLTVQVMPHLHFLVLRDISDRKPIDQTLQYLQTNLEQRIAQQTAVMQQLYRQLHIEASKRQQAEAALNRSEQQFQLAAEIYQILGAMREIESRQLETDLSGLPSTGAVERAIANQQLDAYQQAQQHNAELERQVQERTIELQRALNFEALLRRMIEKVRDSLDEGHILQTAVQELALGIGTCSCDIGLYDLERQISVICCEQTNATATPILGLEIAMPTCADVYAQLLQGQSIQFCWRQLPEQPTRLGVERLVVLACPLMDDQGVIGDLWLYKPEGTCFEAAEVQLAEQVAAQCAIALRQARLYQTAQAQVEELGRLNLLKDDFLSAVSHELRTPMANMQMAIQMLEITLNKAEISAIVSSHLPAPTWPSSDTSSLENLYGKFMINTHDADRYFQILKNECEREIGLINNLLDLSRLDAGNEPLMMTQVDLRLWIPYLVEPFVERAHRQRQQVAIAISTELPSLETDLACLERILLELLNNACKYTPPGETITIAAGTTNSKQTASGEADASLFISISNSGVDIPSAEVDRLFERFYRVPNNDPWEQGGTGLGLALVKKLAEHLGVELSAECRNRRMTFTLRFPGG